MVWWSPAEFGVSVLESLGEDGADGGDVDEHDGDAEQGVEHGDHLAQGGAWHLVPVPWQHNTSLPAGHGAAATDGGGDGEAEHEAGAEGPHPLPGLAAAPARTHPRHRGLLEAGTGTAVRDLLSSDISLENDAGRPAPPHLGRDGEVVPLDGHGPDEAGGVVPGGGCLGGDVHEAVVLDVVEDGGAGDHVDRDQHDHTHLVVTITHYRYPDFRCRAYLCEQEGEK